MSKLNEIGDMDTSEIDTDEIADTEKINEALRRVGKASLTYLGGTIITPETGERLVREMHEYTEARNYALSLGISPYMISKARQVLSAEDFPRS